MTQNHKLPHQRKSRKAALKGSAKAAPISSAPGQEVQDLGNPRSVQSGGEVKDLGGPSGFSPERPQTPPTEGTAPAQPITAKPGETPPAVTQEAPKKEGEAPTDEADPRLEPYTKEMKEKGTLSPESIKKAAKEFGLPEAVVKSYVDAQSQSLAVSNEIVTAAHGVVGGEAEWPAFAKWANDNMDQETVNAMVEALAGKSPIVAKALVNQAFQQYKATGGGKPPADLTRGGGAAPNEGGVVQGFSSRAEQSAAIRDRRYNTDPAYRAQVEARIQVSRF